MSTADPKYSQVWSQIQHWPIELRQDLASEIIKSVEIELTQSSRPWTEAKNARRLELIDKEIQCTLRETERRELELLTREMRIHRRRVAPVPIQGAMRLHQELVEKDRPLGQNNPILE